MTNGASQSPDELQSLEVSSLVFARRLLGDCSEAAGVAGHGYGIRMLEPRVVGAADGQRATAPERVCHGEVAIEAP